MCVCVSVCVRCEYTLIHSLKQHSSHAVNVLASGQTDGHVTEQTMSGREKHSELPDKKQTSRTTSSVSLSPAAFGVL